MGEIFSFTLSRLHFGWICRWDFFFFPKFAPQIK